jgi:hypothetical protein
MVVPEEEILRLFNSKLPIQGLKVAPLPHALELSVACFHQ